MPQNGYWIECIPVATGNDDLKNGEEIASLYRAVIASIPEASVEAKTPDTAIQALRDKLANLRHDYSKRGQSLPEHDNPIRPPRNMKAVKGWISLYVQMSDNCENH